MLIGVSLFFSLIAAACLCSTQDLLTDQNTNFGISNSNQTLLWPSKKSPELHQETSTQSPGAIVSGYFLAEKSNTRLNLSDKIDAKLSEILSRNGPDIRSSRYNRDFGDINLDVSKRAWLLLHEHAKVAIHDRVNLIQPTIEQLLIEAEASQECLNSSRKVFEGAKRMDSWALKLLNSWGNFPPIGLFEGTYTEMGSYHVCTRIPKNSLIDHAHYCTITYRPVMPSHKDYELVLKKEPAELLRLFSRTNQDNNATHSNITDAFTDILEHSNYFHYLYFKWGTCWPIGCSPFDVKRITKYLGRTNILLNGPVKCYSNFKDDYEEPGKVDLNEIKVKKLKISTDDANDGLFIWKPYFTNAQLYALIFLTSVTSFILLMTIIDLFVNYLPRIFRGLLLIIKSDSGCDGKVKSVICTADHIGNNFALNGSHKPLQDDSLIKTPEPTLIVLQQQQQLLHEKTTQRDWLDGTEKSSFMRLVEDCSVIGNISIFFTINQSQIKNDILCLNGIRCLTMLWIILAHIMMYNDWGGFGRTIEIEKSLESVVTQPLFNGSYLVDTFFLMSGLLTAFTFFKSARGKEMKFRVVPFLASRWLRLTPQILLISMIYIVLTLIYDGPHWYQQTGEYSENCSENWWINMLHLQAFYKIDYMCNFVTWWVSIDSLYHLYAIAIIWIIIVAGHKAGLLSIVLIIVSHVTCQGLRHYQLSFPPNLLSSIPQTGAMWGELTLRFFWRPYSHSVPFFMGFYLGYLFALKSKMISRLLNPKRALVGWILTVIGLFSLSYSTYWWVQGTVDYSRLPSTVFHVAGPFIWATSYSWIIVACHFGYGGWFNDFLSSKIFLVLGKASYLVYLSHFHVIFFLLGSQNLLLEPTPTAMLTLILSIIVISTMYGSFICIFFELPWMKIQKRIMKFLI